MQSRFDPKLVVVVVVGRAFVGATMGRFAKRVKARTFYRTNAAKRAKTDIIRVQTLVQRLDRTRSREAASYLSRILLLLRVQAVAGTLSLSQARFMAIEQRWILDVTAWMLQSSAKQGGIHAIAQLRRLRRSHALHLREA